MANIKHVGQVINTQKRVIVVFREIPDEPESCLVVDTDAAPDWMHDDLITAVESNGAQASANFYEYAQPFSVHRRIKYANNIARARSFK